MSYTKVVRYLGARFHYLLGNFDHRDLLIQELCTGRMNPLRNDVLILNVAKGNSRSHGPYRRRSRPVVFGSRTIDVYALANMALHSLVLRRPVLAVLAASWARLGLVLAAEIGPQVDQISTQKSIRTLMPLGVDFWKDFRGL